MLAGPRTTPAQHGVPDATQRNADTGSPSTSATAIRSIPAGAIVVQAASKNEAGGGEKPRRRAVAASNEWNTGRSAVPLVSRAPFADDRAPSLRQPDVAPGAGSHRGQDRLLVSDNDVHHNKGPGLWTDINNIDTTYERNTVHNNTSHGIFHEISYRAIIRNNRATDNAGAERLPGWGMPGFEWQRPAT